MYELGLDFRAAGMPRRATRAMEEVLLEEPGHEGALRALASLYEEQARFNEAAGLWQRLGKRRGEDTSKREHHLLVAAAQAALAREDLDRRSSCSRRRRSSTRRRTSSRRPRSSRPRARTTAARRSGSSQALLADPALAPHLLPGLIAAEEGLVERMAAVRSRKERRARRGRRADGGAGARRRSPSQRQLAEGTLPLDRARSGAREADGRARFPTTSRPALSASACSRRSPRSRRRPVRGSRSR